MKPNRLPVVYDCMIFLQGLITENGVAVRCLELVENEEIELFLSQPILLEIEDVLTRPKLQAQFPLLTKERAGKLLELLNRKATFVEKVPEIFQYPRDPKDEKYINLAAAVTAKYLVTHDKDLLDLVNGYTDEAKEFRQRFRYLNVIEPLKFLLLIESMRTEG